MNTYTIRFAFTDCEEKQVQADSYYIDDKWMIFIKNGETVCQMRAFGLEKLTIIANTPSG